VSPIRYHGRGSFVIQRQFAGIGLIRRASGTTDPAEFRAINVMLTTLFRRRRMDYLTAIRDGELHPLEVLLHVERCGINSVDLLPLPGAMAPIADAWREWMEGTKRPNTRRMYDLAWRYLEPHLGDTATLADLAPALVALRRVMADKAPSFNRTRASVQAFVRHRVGGRHSAYLAIEGVQKIKERAARREGLLLTEAIALRDAMPAAEGRVWWHLVMTGMRVGEFYRMNGAVWGIDDNVVVVKGTKTDNANRVVPRIVELTPPEAPLRRFRDVLRAHGVTPHIARYTFKSFAEDAGIPANRVEQYLGHASQGLSGLYSRVQLRAWLDQDRPVLVAYVAAAEEKVIAARRAELKRA